MIFQISRQMEIKSISNRFVWHKIIFLILMGAMSNCKNETRSKRKIGDEYVVAKFINDSIYDGVVDFYNLQGKILSSKAYKNGVLNGSAKNFYPNGKVSDSVNYTFGLLNGFHLAFKTNGELEYLDYYTNGLSVGPQIFYEKGSPHLFYFLNFENTPIYEAHYDSFGKVDKFKGQIINVYPFSAILKSKSACGIFAFMIHPPSVAIKYSVILKNSNTNEQRKVADFDVRQVYLDTVLESPPNGYKYYYRAILTDSLNQVNRVYLNELNYSDSTEK